MEATKKYITAKIKQIVLGALIILILNIGLYAYLFAPENENLKIYFLNVGQGDSELIVLPDNIKILVDAGPANKRASRELSKILSPFDRRIDIALISHPQLDHYGGLSNILGRYEVGAFISNGEKREIASYMELKDEIASRDIQEITLAKGDRIRYKDSVIEIINPPKNLIGHAKDLNDTSIVMVLKTKGTKALFTGDIGEKTERQIASLVDSVDILKIPHHGSKYSSTEKFLSRTKPKIGVIEVGKNSYGHPTNQTLSRLKKYGIETYRTDQTGTIKIESNNKEIKIYSVQ